MKRATIAVMMACLISAGYAKNTIQSYYIFTEVKLTGLKR